MRSEQNETERIIRNGTKGHNGTEEGERNGKTELCFSGTRKLVGYLVAHNWWQLGPNVAHNNTTIPAYIG